MRFLSAIVTTSLLLLTPMWALDKSMSSMVPTHLEISDTAWNGGRLRLTTEIISSHYCREAANDTLLNLLMKIRLRYTNEGQTPLIFYKHDNRILRTTVKNELAVVTNGPPVFDLSLTTVTGGKDRTIDRQVPSSSFVILAPGDSYDTVAELIIFVRQDGKEEQSDGLLPGDYFLQVIASTWPETTSLAETLRDRWQPIGTLWYQNAKSDLMQFKIDRHPKSVKCPEP